jgi:hypothetical protein
MLILYCDIKVHVKGHCVYASVVYPFWLLCRYASLLWYSCSALLLWFVDVFC